MKSYLMIALLGLVGLLGCKLESEDQTKATDNENEIQNYFKARGITPQKSNTGLYYVITPGTGTRSPQKYDDVAIHYVLYRMDGLKLDSTSLKLNKPDYFPFGIGYKLPGLEEGLAYMKEGDKATLLLPNYLAFGSQIFDILPAYSVVRYEVTLVSTRTEEERINEFIAKNKLTVDETTSSGVRIVRTLKNPTGADLKSGQLITMNYTGSLMRDIRKLVNGQYAYDPVFGSGSLSFGLGLGTVVKGIDEAIAKLKVGEKAKLIIPAAAGYAEKGVSDAGIPPYTTLVFDVEIVSAK
ncbi:MAG: FKBP-type peptidyl-prolyl cis-trans isomerase [Spirosomataceae bacterium]